MGLSHESELLGVLIRWSLEEIHLSHNEIRQKGMAALLVALALHPPKAYPRAAPGEEVPCWVRLEHNQVSHAEYLLNLLSQDPTKLRTCLAPRRDRGPSCTSFRCQAVENVAHVHLYCVDKQDDAQSETKKHAQAALQEALEDCRQGHPGSDIPKTQMPPLLTPSDAAECRLVELNVDPDKGAGLDLSEGHYGFVVDAVEAEPGQQLSPGDVLLEIDGVQLWGGLGLERLGEAFGSRFADGARLRVARADAVQGRALWQQLSIPGPSLSSRCDDLRESLGQDLVIMGRQCGVQAKLEDDGIWLRGHPQQQRWAADELPRLLAFYFPETSLAFPSFHWRGDPDELCRSEIAEPSFEDKMRQELRLGELPDGSCAELASWEKLLRGQWCEDDDIFDEDLPVEPLEAPDDGPDVFEGQVLAPETHVSDPLRVLMLVGLPGSGKSTLAARMHRLGWVVINQDTLGDNVMLVLLCWQHLKVLCEASEDQLMDSGFNAYRQQGEQSTYDAEALVGAIFGDLPDDAGPEAACADTGGETATFGGQAPPFLYLKEPLRLQALQMEDGKMQPVKRTFLRALGCYFTSTSVNSGDRGQSGGMDPHDEPFGRVLSWSDCVSYATHSRRKPGSGEAGLKWHADACRRRPDVESTTPVADGADTLPTQSRAGATGADEQPKESEGDDVSGRCAGGSSHAGKDPRAEVEQAAGSEKRQCFARKRVLASIARAVQQCEQVVHVDPCSARMLAEQCMNDAQEHGTQFAFEKLEQVGRDQDRKKCVATAIDALSSGQKVVIDRCNVTRLQRRVWLGVADENQASVACIWLDVPEGTCYRARLQPCRSVDSSEP
ncbi:hypothetical protein AK812_SmicGene40797 [Symbiodinium microadriaticum]|uniref:PDZ domain-containing protein n=1 Tax=Symbiodinium microadriaticum TaxID=2951 RepID=A0A1Q9C7S9_SYMMI|nr:hypothetical protein AK812_SmicGene40797 [Symbiodinium microadriaticum]